MPHRKKPCDACPWVVTTTPGEFSSERYAVLRATTVQPDGNHAEFGAPLFACHKTQEGTDMACAGWLASVGDQSVSVRVLIAQGRLPASVLRPGADWPVLFPDYDTMAATQGG